jgi:hypothetical protein
MSRTGDSIANSSQRKPIHIGAEWWCLTVPLLFLAGAISIPVVLVAREVQRIGEKRFAAEMKKLGRTIVLGEVASGSVLIEWLSLKGPTRWWWTPDALQSSTALFPAEGSHEFDERHELYLEKYIGSKGSARLVTANRDHRRRFHDEQLLTGNLVCVEIPPSIGNTRT